MFREFIDDLRMRDVVFAVVLAVIAWTQVALWRSHTEYAQAVDMQYEGLKSQKAALETNQINIATLDDRTAGMREKAKSDRLYMLAELLHAKETILENRLHLNTTASRPMNAAEREEQVVALEEMGIPRCPYGIHWNHRSECDAEPVAVPIQRGGR